MSDITNKTGVQKISNYGLASYLKMKGYPFEIIESSTGQCCLYTEISIKDLDQRKEEYFNSDFKLYDQAARKLRDLRNKICCPKF